LAPPLTPEQAQALRQGFALAAADPIAFTEAFYTRLFELLPAARALFPAELSAQHEKMAQTLATVVSYLEQPDALTSELHRLGSRHLAYGAQAVHYATVGEALLHTLNARVPGGLDADTRNAWQRFYAWLAAEMLSG